jgi:hypothetical protein
LSDTFHGSSVIVPAVDDVPCPSRNATAIPSRSASGAYCVMSYISEAFISAP